MIKYQYGIYFVYLASLNIILYDVLSCIETRKIINVKYDA